MEVTDLQGIGKILKETREEKGISLEDVAGTTKIRQKYLEAIEDENFAVLPGEVYAKGFVIAYLKYLGIRDRADVVEILKQKETMTMGKKEEESQEQEKMEKEEELLRTSRKKRSATAQRKTSSISFEEKPLNKKGSLIIILSVVAILLLLGLQWIYTRSQQETQTPKNTAQQEEQSTAQQDDNSTAAQENVPQQPEEETPVEPPVYSDLEMHIEILDLSPNTTEQCWMQITADGKKQELTMEEGQTQDIRATDRIQLNLGNAGVVKITLNGQELGTLGSQGEVVKKEFLAKDYVTTQS